jgi:hypothetical protein
MVSLVNTLCLIREIPSKKASSRQICYKKHGELQKEAPRVGQQPGEA